MFEKFSHFNSRCYIRKSKIITYKKIMTLITEVQDGILQITINRPDKMNALNKDVLNDLNETLEAAFNNNEVKSILITGSGEKAFVAGADIAEFVPLNNEQAVSLSKTGQDLFSKIENSKKPIIAAVNGFALGGGCELAMSCHFRVASENAKFGQPEVNLGLIPGYGGTQRLTKLIGKGRAMELIMTADMIGASEALNIGLVNHVYPLSELIVEARKILTKINTKAPLAVSKCILLANAAENANPNGFEMEAIEFGSCFDTTDKIEGVTAFLEKRKANFQGN